MSLLAKVMTDQQLDIASNGRPRRTGRDGGEPAENHGNVEWMDCFFHLLKRERPSGLVACERVFD